MNQKSILQGLLNLAPQNTVNPRYRSGAIKLHDERPLSRGYQLFETNPEKWPINKPVTKVDGLVGNTPYPNAVMSTKIFADL